MLTACPSPPPTIYTTQARNWTPVFAMCAFAIVVYTGFGGTAIAYSLKTIVDNSKVGRTQ